MKTSAAKMYQRILERLEKNGDLAILLALELIDRHDRNYFPLRYIKSPDELSKDRLELVARLLAKEK